MLTPDQWVGLALLLGLILALAIIRRAWHEWLGVAR